jgi:hypothetical protein
LYRYVEGAVVRLVEADGDEQACTTSRADGGLSFGSVESGTYAVGDVQVEST